MEIYLDNAATTRVCSGAVDACVNAMTNEYGNPSSLHRRGFNAEKLINDAKNTIADLLFADSDEIVFTSGATESNNLCIIGSAMANKRRGNKIITSAIEHPSVLQTMKHLKTLGFEVIEVTPNNNEYIVSDFIQHVDDNTIMVSVMLVNNETGLVLPVFEIAKAVKAKNPATIVHTDAVQGFMKIPIKLKNSGIDLLSFSGHKAYAPKGVGGFYIKRKTRLIPQIHGGGQQNGMRSGTEMVPLIAALAGSVKQNKPNIVEDTTYYKMLNKHIITKLSLIEDITINSDKNCVPHIINFSVKGIRSEIMLHFLESFEIYVSSGSACSKGEKNYVLSSFNKDKSISDTAIRISFSKETTVDMLDVFIEKLLIGINTLAHTK